MKDKTIVIRGVLDWAKIIGPARPHTGKPQYDKGPAWSVDVTPSDAHVIKEYALEGKLRSPNKDNTKEHRTDSYLSLKVIENRADGKTNAPPKIVDATGKDWDNGLIGNGTVADVKVKIVDYGKGIEKGVYLQAIRVLDHVPYETEDFAPLSEDDKYFSAAEGSDFAAPENDDAESEPDAEQDNLFSDDVPF